MKLSKSLLCLAVFSFIFAASLLKQSEVQAANLKTSIEEAHDQNHLNHDGRDHEVLQSKAPSNLTDDHEVLSLKRVEAKQVCMMNNAFMGSEQIPVEVEGKTYYGCCPMCKERLKNDAAARQAIDPVSGKAVDKALAVIGAAPDNSIYYFENEENLKKFNNDSSLYINPVNIEP